MPAIKCDMKLQQKSAQARMPYKDEIVKEAYKKIEYKNGFKINSKSDYTLVTDSDILVDKYLTNKIK